MTVSAWSSFLLIFHLCSCPVPLYVLLCVNCRNVPSSALCYEMTCAFHSEQVSIVTLHLPLGVCDDVSFVSPLMELSPNVITMWFVANGQFFLGVSILILYFHYYYQVCPTYADISRLTFLIWRPWITHASQPKTIRKTNEVSPDLALMTIYLVYSHFFLSGNAINYLHIFKNMAYGLIFSARICMGGGSDDLFTVFRV